MSCKTRRESSNSLTFPSLLLSINYPVNRQMTRNSHWIRNRLWSDYGKPSRRWTRRSEKKATRERNWNVLEAKMGSYNPTLRKADQNTLQTLLGTMEIRSMLLQNGVEIWSSRTEDATWTTEWWVKMPKNYRRSRWPHWRWTFSSHWISTKFYLIHWKEAIRVG